MFYRTNFDAIRPLHEWTRQPRAPVASPADARQGAGRAEAPIPINSHDDETPEGGAVATTAPTLENLILNLSHEITVRASLDVTFDSLLEQMGPGSENAEGKPMPMVLEAWPGGRWFRDLGQGNGHFWGHVQAIKRPTLLEITGPLFMSSPVVSNMQYRLKEVDWRDDHLVPALRARIPARRLQGKLPARLDAALRTRAAAGGIGEAASLSDSYQLPAASFQLPARVGSRKLEAGSWKQRRHIMSMIEALCRSSNRKRRPRDACSSGSHLTSSRGSRMTDRCRSGSWRCTWRRCPARLPRFPGNRPFRCREFDSAECHDGR